MKSHRRDTHLISSKLKKETKLEQELQANNNRLMAILSSIGDGLFVVDKNYIVTLANPVALRLLGIRSSDIIGKDLSRKTILFHGEREMTRENRPVTLALESGKTSMYGPEYNFYLRNSSGIKFPVAISVAPIKNERSVTGAIMVFRDVTEEKRTEESQSNFITVASHQLRTPLTSMRWFLEMLLGGDAGKTTEQQRRFVEHVYDGTERMIKLVGLLLQIARAEAGKIDIEPVFGNLREATEVVVHSFKRTLTERDQRITISTKPAVFPGVSFDKEVYATVLGTLLRNALWYSPEGSEIEISLSKKEGGIECAVRDSGPGIPQKDQGRIFKRFFRAQNAVGLVPDGWGLELVLAKYIIEAWGGTCRFISREKSGSTYFLTTIPSAGMKAAKGWINFTA